MATSRPVAGWYRDPSGRHEHRWWNGSAWTAHVITLGLRSTDFGDEPSASAVAMDPGPSSTPGSATTPETDGTAALPRRWPIAVWAVVGAGAGLLVLGALLPWAEATSKSASFSSDGIDGDGAITVFAAVAIMLLFVVASRRTLAAGLAIATAVLAGAIGVRNAVDISERATRLLDQHLVGVSAQVGIGVWVTIAGAAIALVGGIIAFAVASRTASRSSQ
jgi:hypothetical protein